MLVALATAGVLILHLTRGTTLWFDDWNWALYRRSGLHWLFKPYNDHLSLVPILVYRVLFALEGVRSYEPYRVLITAGQLVCGGAVFTYARRRVGDYLALLAAAVILFLGPGWQDILWPFQIAWLIAIATGIGALLALDRRDRLGDALACALLVISLASSSIGVAIAIGTVVDVSLTRRRWRDAWIVAIPLGLYAAWALADQAASTSIHNVLDSWRFVFDSAAASLAAPLGLSGQTVANEAGTVVAYGSPLLVATALLLIWRYRRLGRPSPRAWALAAILVAFWLLIGAGRGHLISPFVSRYVYVDSVFALLLAAELARGARVRKPVAVGLGVITVGAVASNLGQLREAAMYLRRLAPTTRAELAALDITRSTVSSGYVETHFPGYPFLIVRAGPYLAMERSIGSPSYTQAGLVSASEPAREAADAELIAIHQVALEPTPGGATGGRCLSWRPPAFAPAGSAGSELDLALPAAGLGIRTGVVPATIGVRRFAGAFTPLGTVAAGSSVTLRIGSDGSSQPWKAQIVAPGPVTVCSVAG
jgi:hypothetical protein